MPREETGISADNAAKADIVYAPQEIIQRFEEVFASLDLKKELAALGHGLDSFFRRGHSLREFTALNIALWELALESSFPGQKEEIIRMFVSTSPLPGKGSKRKTLLQRVELYDNLLMLKKHADFTPVAVYMAGCFSRDAESRKTLQLKLSLTIRRSYQLIFDNLIPSYTQTGSGDSGSGLK
jgi:hypothetical protein